MKLEDIMFFIDEAMFNLKDSYPNKEKALRAYEALISHLNYTPKARIIVTSDDLSYCTLKYEEKK